MRTELPELIHLENRFPRRTESPLSDKLSRAETPEELQGSIHCVGIKT